MDKYLKRLMKKANPVAQLLMSPPFRQQEVVSKKEYNRKKIKTPSEEMQDELEPIPCPMHEDYDNEKNNVQYSNNISIEYFRMHSNANGEARCQTI